MCLKIDGTKTKEEYLLSIEGNRIKGTDRYLFYKVYNTFKRELNYYDQYILQPPFRTTDLIKSMYTSKRLIGREQIAYVSSNRKTDSLTEKEKQGIVGTGIHCFVNKHDAENLAMLVQGDVYEVEAKSANIIAVGNWSDSPFPKCVACVAIDVYRVKE